MLGAAQQRKEGKDMQATERRCKELQRNRGYGARKCKDPHLF